MSLNSLEVYQQNPCVTLALPKPPVYNHTHCTIKYDVAKFKGHLDWNFTDFMLSKTGIFFAQYVSFTVKAGH